MEKQTLIKQAKQFNEQIKHDNKILFFMVLDKLNKKIYNCYSKVPSLF